MTSEVSRLSSTRSEVAGVAAANTDDAAARMIVSFAKHMPDIVSLCVWMASEENTAREAESTEREAPAEQPMLYCPVCDQRLQPLKCKLICERCGYFMSCADYY
jgi:Zn finger protein HypA/HybF involved in hydrogenase expression